MIDIRLSVVLHLSKGGKQALCVGKLRRHGDKLLASPTLVGPAFAQFTSAELDQSAQSFLKRGPRLMPAKSITHLVALAWGVLCWTSVGSAALAQAEKDTTIHVVIVET